jgi:rare lipoprotein A
MESCSGVRILPVVVALGFILAGCASSGPQFSENHSARHARGQPIYRIDPYRVKGVWYTPRADYNYDETGTASWYGPGFDQHATADGEIYDMNQLSAAHKTLPLPSVVQVTNLQNGRSLQLRVNDRGPFVDGRIIDLSRRAAQLLGFETIGTAQVRVRILKDESIQVAAAAMHGEMGNVMLASAAATEPAPAPRIAPRPIAAVPSAGPASLRAAETVGAPPVVAPPPEPIAPVRTAAAPPHHYWPTLIAAAHAETLHPPAAPASSRLFVQAGAFAVPANAQRVGARIATLGKVEIVQSRSGAALYRVRVGPVTSEAAATRLLRKVVDSGYPGARVVTE